MELLEKCIIKVPIKYILPIIKFVGVAYAALATGFGIIEASHL
jgi:hypothetical protein